LLYETLIVLGLTLIPSLIWPSLKGALVYLPLVYVLVEHFARHRSWGQMGLQRQVLMAALKSNWLLIVLVAGLIQIGVVLLARLWWPELLAHIQGRVPLFDPKTVVPLVALVLISTFIEELCFRGLFQARLSWYMPPLAANLLVSVPFALLHWSAGAPAVVAVDVALVALDSLLYGLIYTRGKNLWVAWIAHALADVVALILLLGH
jgi:membrane protease YdiL (CAAX protease family)